MEIITWIELSGFIVGNILSLLSLIATCAIFVIGMRFNRKNDDKKEIKEKEMTDLINSIEKSTSAMNNILESIENIISLQFSERAKTKLQSNSILDNNRLENLKTIDLFKNNDLKSVEEVTKKAKLVSFKRNKLNQKEKTNYFLKNKKKIN